MSKGKADNVGSCVEIRSHESITPEPMYLANDTGHRFYEELGHRMKTTRTKSTVWADDASNKTGMRAKGGY
ncbi:MAG: hypothetical protein V4509_01975 [Patescibacteria group bacterium]